MHGPYNMKFSVHLLCRGYFKTQFTSRDQTAVLFSIDKCIPSKFALDFVSESLFSVMGSFQFNLMCIVSDLTDRRIFTVGKLVTAHCFSRSGYLIWIYCFQFHVDIWMLCRSLAEIGLFCTRIQSNSLPVCQISVNALRSVVTMCTTTFNTINSAYFSLKELRRAEFRWHSFSVRY
jgi:hypothetical protein